MIAVMADRDSAMDGSGREEAQEVTAAQGRAVVTKAAILAAARHLFAQRDLASVSIRDIAEAAGVSHGLVQRYFGAREQMIAEIIRQEVEAFTTSPPPLPTADVDDHGAEFRTWFAAGFDHFHDYAALIVRAELAGVRPETMLDPATPTPAAQLADHIAALRAAARSAEGPDARVAEGPDARIISAYINAALFSFSTMAPWLMASVGLSADDYEAHLEQIADISYRLITLATQPQPGT